ncbi:hypothetical protein BT96DRAFT_1011492 [Gymnopus androsaceus JB14]|uniref:Uncharacterized protein n=1 Tax=Gymnopus androsaceus JB14 TaxID=1447944 RepID=A0A6A4ILK4_9AGAR|nr:hypothetical protein BT96DRAFT_1011492 [Gymnopus androsaceus JB14]
MSTLQLYLDRSGDTPLFLNVFIAIPDVDTPVTSCTGTPSLMKHRQLLDRAGPGLQQFSMFRGRSTAPSPSRLNVDYVSGEIMGGIQDYPNLTALKLSVYKTDIDLAMNTITLAFLKTLTLNARSNLHPKADLLLEELFTAFVLPCLADLRVSVKQRKIPSVSMNSITPLWSAKDLSAFISRSSCILISLSVTGIKISHLELIAALRILSALVDLKIDDSHLPSESSWITTQSPSPSLRTLSPSPNLNHLLSSFRNFAIFQ